MLYKLGTLPGVAFHIPRLRHHRFLSLAGGVQVVEPSLHLQAPAPTEGGVLPPPPSVSPAFENVEVPDALT